MLLETLRLELEKLRERGRLRSFAPILRGANSQISIGAKSFIDFSSWDLLDLSNNPEVVRAMQEEAELSGLGLHGPRAVFGTTSALESLETFVAKFLGYQAAVLFSSRNQSWLSLMSSLFNERDLLLFDERSLIPVSDSALLNGIESRTFHADDLDSLGRVLSSLESESAIILVEAFMPGLGFSPDIKAISSLCHKFEANFIVDESFSLGFFGDRGASSAEQFAFEQRPLALIGALPGGFSGDISFISSSDLVASTIKNRSRSFVATGSIPSPLCSALEKALRISETKLKERKRIANLGLNLKRKIAQHLHPASIEVPSPIVSLRIETWSSGDKIRAELFRRGFLVSSLTSEDRSILLQLLISSRHSEADVEALGQALVEILPRIKTSNIK